MSGDTTYQSLERLSHMPDKTSPTQGDRIAGQKYYDVLITGGEISNVTLSNVNITDISGLSVDGDISATGNITGSNLSGTNTGDQTITLTGAVTGSGTGSFATTLASGINANKIANGTISSVEFQYLNGVTSLIQEQLDSKQITGFIEQNGQVSDYTTILTDAGKHIFHPSSDMTPRTFTIAANASVSYDIGTAISFVNQNSAGVITIAIDSDTLRLAGAGTTGSRTLATNGIATALKIAGTEWIISGTGLT